MSVRLGVAALTATLLAALAAGQTMYRASLAGNREVPGPGANSTARGYAAAVLDGTGIYYVIFTENVSSPTAAHIHIGAAGSGGGVVVPLVSDSGGFTDLGNSNFMATGTVSVSSETAQAIVADPAGYYFNVHNADFPGGAVRGQLFGDGAHPRLFAGDLRGGREPSGTDGDGRGFGALRLHGSSLYYFLWARDIAAPTASHVHAGHAGVDGGVVASLVTSADGFTDHGGGVYSAAGVATVNAFYSQLLVESPGDFYFNIHNADFPSGAIRGQLAPMETHVYLAIASRAQGQAGSNWVTDLRLLSPHDLDATIRAEWYPSNSAGLTGPAKVTQLTVVPGGQAVYNNIVSSVFSANGNGAVRLVSWTPFAAASRIFNDQRANPEIGGTFGQFTPGLSPAGALSEGAVPLLSNRPVGDGADFRSNAGYFNPWPWPVGATVSLRRPDGTELGSASLTLQPFANVITGVFNLVSGVPGGQQTQADMFLVFSAASPVFFYGSVVDNKTNDAILPLPARFVHVPLASTNNPPSGTITMPSSSSVAASVGEQLVFQGSVSDPDGDAVTVEWDFDDGVTSGMLSTTHSYAQAGTYVVTLTATDEHGLTDPSPAAVTITVSAPSVTLSQLQAEIFTPICAGCHPPNGGGLDLRAGQTHGSAVNVPSFEMPALDRIEPGDPDNSYLYRKVVGTGITGSRMPQGGPFLSQAQIDKLRQWIVDGAKND